MIKNYNEIKVKKNVIIFISLINFKKIIFIVHNINAFRLILFSIYYYTSYFY